MRKMKFLAAIPATLFVTAALADTVNVTSVTNMTSPSGVAVTSNSAVGFNPGRDKIVFKIAGKTCTFNSSGNPWNAGQGAGCNYSLTVNNSTNTLSNPGSNANGCTPANQMLAACQ